MALSTLSRQSLSTLRSTAVALTLAAAAPLAFAQTGPTVAPTGITTSNVTATSVDVSWTAIAANAWGNDGGGNDYAPGDATSKYTACADTVSPTTPVCVDSANGTTTTATITPLTAGTEYVITVKAVSAGGDGSEGAAGSNITTTAAQETAPATPAWGSPETDNLADTSFTINWQATTSWGNDSSGTPITAGSSEKYSACVKEGANPEQCDDVANNVTTHTFTSLSASTAYTYSVKAINGNTTANTSPALNGTGSVTTLGLETAPAQPGTISTVGAPTATAFTVQWTASANFGTDAAGTTITAGNYKICRSDGVTATADKACQTIPSATTPLQATFSGLNAGITYQLSLTATNANTTANTSTPRTLGVLTANGTPDNVPPQPGPITVTGTTDTSVSITWPAVANFGTNGTGVAYTAGNYVVCRDDGAGGAVNQDCQTVASTAARQVTFSGLTTGLTYKVEVKATNANATNNTSTASTRNIQALAGGVGAPVDVPTLGEWGVIILSLLLAGSAVLVGRRRRF